MFAFSLAIAPEANINFEKATLWLLVRPHIMIDVIPIIIVNFFKPFTEENKFENVSF